MRGRKENLKQRKQKEKEKKEARPLTSTDHRNSSQAVVKTAGKLGADLSLSGYGELPERFSPRFHPKKSPSPDYFTPLLAAQKVK